MAPLRTPRSRRTWERLIRSVGRGVGEDDSVVDHEYDCVVVGAGGAGLRAAMGLSENVGDVFVGIADA